MSKFGYGPGEYSLYTDFVARAVESALDRMVEEFGEHWQDNANEPEDQRFVSELDFDLFEPGDDPVTVAAWVEDHETCDHGMSAWLCMGPMHYPSAEQERQGLYF